MIKFNERSVMFQYFINEYMLPKTKVLVIGFYDIELQNMIQFIDSEVFFIKETSEYGIDIVCNYKNVPFEDNSFDIVINLSGINFKYEFLKTGGSLFINYLQVQDFYKNYTDINKLLYNLNEIDYIVLKK
jgi:hypothetical protein